MNLRLRLIVAFFLLSVVPLGAITLYMYTSNAKAMRDAAGHEAEMLASELSQRMQTVTTQLSQQVERLMDLPVSEASPAAQAVARATSPMTTGAPAAPVMSPSATPAPAARPTRTASAAQVTAAMAAAARAEQFGDMAMLLNNIEIRGQRGFGRGGGRQGGRGGPGPAPGAASPSPDGAQFGRRGADPSRGQLGDRGGGPRFPGDPSRGGGTGLGGGAQRGAPGAEVQGPAPAPASGGSPAGQGGGRFAGGPGGPAGGPGGPGGGPGGPGGGPGRGRGGDGRGGPGAEDPNADPTRIRIDLAQVRREVFDQLVPDQAAFEKLTPEERARVIDEVNQRMRGVTQGIELLQKEVTARAADAKAKQTAEAAIVEAEKDAAPPVRRDQAGGDRDAVLQGADAAQAAGGSNPTCGRRRPGAGPGRDVAKDDALGQPSRRAGRTQRRSGRPGERGSGHAEPARHGLHDDTARSRRSAVRRREGRQAVHANGRRQEAD